MLSVRLQGVYLNKGFVTWSTDERRPQKLSLSSQATFNNCVRSGIISVAVLSQGASVATGHIEYAKAVSGENAVACKNRDGATVCNLTLFIERKGFVTKDLFDIDTLLDQCALLSSRYASHSPIVKTALGFDIPAAFFTRYVQKATAAEHEFMEHLMRIVEARYGKRTVSPAMYAECVATYLNMCVDTTQIANQARVEAVYSHMFIPASHIIGLGCEPTMVHLADHEGNEHVAVALLDNTDFKNYLCCMDKVSPVKLQGDGTAPPGLEEFKCPTKAFSKVLFQYGKQGMRKLDADVEDWLAGRCREEYRQFLEMDTMVLDNAIKLYAEVPHNTGRVISVNASGGTSGNPTRRYMKKGIGRFLSGCRSVVVRMEKDGNTHEWTEYVVFD